MKTKLFIFQLFCLAKQYYQIAKERFMLHGSGKGVRKQILNFQVWQITDGTNTETYAGF